MDSKEKYINFVVEDLVKNTKINYGQEEIISLQTIFIKSPLTINLFFCSSNLLFYSFKKHVIGKYGVHEDEVKMIWKIYRKRIKIIIKGFTR